MTNKRDQVDLDEALTLLLQNVSLRKLGRRYGVSHVYMSQLLRNKYGDHITDPNVTSLARSIISDYQGVEAAYNYALTILKEGTKETKYLSNKVLNERTKWVTVNDNRLWEVIGATCDSEEVMVPPRFYIYLTISSVITKVLCDAYYKCIATQVTLDVLMTAKKALSTPVAL